MFDRIFDTTKADFYNGDNTSAPNGSLVERKGVENIPIMTRTYLFGGVTLTEGGKKTTLLLSEPHKLLFAIGHNVISNDGSMKAFAGTLSIIDDHTLKYTAADACVDLGLLVTVGWSY